MEHDDDRWSTLQAHGESARPLATTTSVPGAPRDTGDGGDFCRTSHRERRGAYVRCRSRPARQDGGERGRGGRGRTGGRRRRRARRGGRGTVGRGVVRRRPGTDAQSNGGSGTQGSKNEYDDTSADDGTSAYRDECRVVVRHHDLRYLATIWKRRMPSGRPPGPPRLRHTDGKVSAPASWTGRRFGSALPRAGSAFEIQRCKRLRRSCPSIITGSK